MSRLVHIAKASTELELYDPERGLQTIVVAEAAEKIYRRAKDTKRLLEAVQRKLAEQRKYVQWWDSHGNPKGGPKNFADSAKFPGALDPYTLHRWRIRLKEESAYQATLAVAQDRAIRVCEFAKGQTDQRGASGTNENEWFTPAQYIDAARDVLGAIDLDPATHPKAQALIQATQCYTKKQDGLTQPWPGRVWLNPPYMQPFVTQFVQKLVAEVAAGRTTAAILLTHNYTDTSWFHHAASVAKGICFTRGRIRFLSPDGTEAAPTQGQAFFYYGPDVPVFFRRFAAVGLVLRPV